jgi:hypothetical protein
MNGGKKINCCAVNALEEWSPAKKLHVQYLMKYLFEKFSWADALSLSNPKHQGNPYKIDGMFSHCIVYFF